MAMSDRCFVKRRTTLFKFLIAILTTFFVIIFVQNITSKTNLTQLPYDKYNLDCPTKLPGISNEINWRVDLLNNVTQLARTINKAYIHSRGSKSSDYLQQALSYMEKTMDLLDLNLDCATRRKVHRVESVCPEVFKKDIDVPFYEKGFEMENCANPIPVYKLVTVLVIAKARQTSLDLSRIISGIRQYNSKLKIKIGLHSWDQYEGIKSLLTENDHYIVSSNSSKGKIINTLINSTVTKYILLAKDIVWFNKDVRLERLIREIERQNLSSVGGASRNKGGQWRLGCHQAVLQNFTLVYKAGYDESAFDCVYCDYVDGPILIKTDIAEIVRFDEKVSNGLFEDFYLRLNRNGESAICPDVMFFTENDKIDNNTQNWSVFSNKWEISKLRLSSGELLRFPCPKEYDCWHRKSTLSMSYCCQKELADAVDIALKECDHLGIKCELDGGTLLGALKLHTILPWERDADFILPSDKFKSYENSSSLLLKYNYTLKAGRQPTCCKGERLDGGYYALKGPHWRVEFLGQFALDSEKSPGDFITEPTKLPLNGKWYFGPRNPGLHLRNRFGKGIYKHELHGTDLAGTLLWTKYKRRSFLPCEDKLEPNCMARYAADGNLRFGEPIP